MPKPTCSICGGRLMFGSTAALALAIEVEATLAAQQTGRRRRARTVRRSSSAIPSSEVAHQTSPRAAEGEQLARQLHDHIHQIAHLRDTPPLTDLRVQPIAEHDKAIIVSGGLARPDNPLTLQFHEVW